MKSQDILVLLKLISIRNKYYVDHSFYKEKSSEEYSQSNNLPSDTVISVRSLGSALGISKSEISKSLERCKQINLLDNKFNVDTRALFNIIKYAVPYFFPVTKMGLVTGIPTGFAIPALKPYLSSAGTMIYVWPSLYGDSEGIGVEPIYKSVPLAAQQDSFLYTACALIDAYRLGRSREKEIVINILKDELKVK